MKYEKQKGLRIKSRFIWADARTEKAEDTPWVVEFKDGTKKWIKGSEIWGEDGYIKTYINGKEKYGCSSNFMPVRSVRAFRRRLKEWKNVLPKGTKITLVSRYVGYDIHAKIK